MAPVRYGVGPDCRPQPVRGAGLFIYSGCLYLAHAAPQYFYSHEFTEVQVYGSMWVMLYHSAVTEKSQLAAAGIETETAGLRGAHARRLATVSSRWLGELAPPILALLSECITDQ